MQANETDPFEMNNKYIYFMKCENKRKILYFIYLY